MNNSVFIKFLRKIVAVITAVILVFSFALLSGCKNNQNETNGTVGNEIKNVTFQIIYQDKNTKTIQLKTKQDTLANALVEANIIEYRADGFYDTIDGITADFSKDGSWWSITQNGEMTTKGLNTIIIKDNDKYEATYTK